MPNKEKRIRCPRVPFVICEREDGIRDCAKCFPYETDKQIDEEDDERANRLTTEILKKSKELDELFDELAQCDENEAEKVRELINEN
jgi:hypothetical protein